ncbi:MAG: CysS/YqeB C-terminal domain-containing protein, partial [Treponema sp.]
MRRQRGRRQEKQLVCGKRIFRGDSVFCLCGTQSSGNHDGDPEADEINALIAQRTEAKKAKDFAAADKIRDELNARGIIVT